MSYAITTAVKKIAALKKRIKIIQGGTSAGKTIGILEVLIDKCQAEDKTGDITSVTSESFPHLKRGAIRDFLSIMQAQNYFKPDRWNKTDYVYTFETGAILEFFSSDQPSKVRGPRRKRLFMNEANNMPFETFEQLEIRTTEEIYIDYNPTQEFWVQLDVLGKRDDVDLIILTYKDNEALSEEIVKSIEQRRNRAGWWKVYGLGQLGEVEGRIYTGWNEIQTIPTEARLERYGLDFGYHPDPCAVIAIYYYNGGYILDEVLYQLDMSNREIANTLKNLPRALVVADSAEPKSIDEIKMYGLNVVPTNKGADSVRHGIKAVQDLQISVTKRSANLLKEYRNYLWAVDKDGHILPGVPDQSSQDHGLDAVRYAINSLVSVIRKREMFVEKREPRQRSNVGV